jgi:2-iminobutanoate/2-iminopropanoate deaminase
MVPFSTFSGPELQSQEENMSLKRERIQPEKLFVRKDGEKVLYSQVVVVEAADHKQIYVAGQTPRDREGNSVGKGDMRAQIVQVGENIKDALDAAGATLNDVVKTTTYVTDMDEYFKHQDVRMQYFAQALPTSTTVQVSRLSRPEFLVEIEVFAIV